MTWINGKFPQILHFFPKNRSQLPGGHKREEARDAWNWSSVTSHLVGRTSVALRTWWRAHVRSALTGKRETCYPRVWQLCMCQVYLAYFVVELNIGVECLVKGWWKFRNFIFFVLGIYCRTYIFRYKNYLWIFCNFFCHTVMKVD